MGMNIKSLYVRVASVYIYIYWPRPASVLQLTRGALMSS